MRERCPRCGSSRFHYSEYGATCMRCFHWDPNAKKEQALNIPPPADRVQAELDKVSETVREMMQEKIEIYNCPACYKKVERKQKGYWCGNCHLWLSDRAIAEWDTNPQFKETLQFIRQIQARMLGQMGIPSEAPSAPAPDALIAPPTIPAPAAPAPSLAMLPSTEERGQQEVERESELEKLSAAIKRHAFTLDELCKRREHALRIYGPGGLSEQQEQQIAHIASELEEIQSRYLFVRDRVEASTEEAAERDSIARRLLDW